MKECKRYLECCIVQNSTFHTLAPHQNSIVMLCISFWITNDELKNTCKKQITYKVHISEIKYAHLLKCIFKAYEGLTEKFWITITENFTSTYPDKRTFTHISILKSWFDLLIYIFFCLHFIEQDYLMLQKYT